jgi:mannan endo-1,4-beta-mannosidase
MMAAVSAMGATAVRAHTLGVNVGNPLALEPSLGVFNDKGLDNGDLECKDFC